MNFQLLIVPMELLEPWAWNRDQTGKRKEIFPCFPSLLFISWSPKRSWVHLGVVCTERSHLKRLLRCRGPKDNKRHTVNAQHLNGKGTIISTPPWQQTQVAIRAGDHRPDSPGTLKAAPPPRPQALWWELRTTAPQWTRSLPGTRLTCFVRAGSSQLSAHVRD